MRLFDPNFKTNSIYYIVQCSLAMAIIFVVLLLTDSISNMTVIASLGASTFIAITMPHINASRPRYLIGGYTVGAICGTIANYTYNYLVLLDVRIFGHSPHIAVCAVSVGLAIFLMTVLNFEHPPAAALAMGLVLAPDALIASFNAMLSIVLLSIFKTILKKWPEIFCSFI